MTVLNPLQQVDEHIMDDADLAGPLLFFFLFGMLLLLVSDFSTVLPADLQNPIVWKTTVWVYLWFRLTGVDVDIHPSQPHVRQRHRRLPRCVCFGLLLTPNGRCRCSKRSRDARVCCYPLHWSISTYGLVHLVESLATCSHCSQSFGAHSLHRAFS